MESVTQFQHLDSAVGVSLCANALGKTSDKIEEFLCLFSFFYFYSVISCDQLLFYSVISCYFYSVISCWLTLSFLTRDLVICLNLKIPKNHYYCYSIQVLSQLMYCPLYHVLRNQRNVDDSNTTNFAWALYYFYSAVAAKKNGCVSCLVWLVGFYGVSTFVGYLTPNPFLCK